MEEEKAAAYYDELTRKGSGAARFKQGLGFSSGAEGSNHDDVPTRGSSLLSSSSSFLSSFVRASSPSKTEDIHKKVQIETIQNKLKKKTHASDNQKSSRVLDDRSRDRRRSTERERDNVKYRDRDRHSRQRSRSLSPHRRRSSSRDRNRDRDRDRRRRRSRSRERRRSRSDSPRRNGVKNTKHDSKERAATSTVKDKIGVVGYAKMIDGYDNMSAVERLKAKMKFQLSEAAETDTINKGMGPGWERFEFNKDAPLDDEEIEAAVEDDAAIVKRIGQSFRLSAVKAKREEQIKMAHDEAIFGTSSSVRIIEDDAEEDDNTDAIPAAASLVNERVLVMQQGSWRDRAPRRS
ncbi:zinc finger CCCH domain-containing protein 13 isoform X3 [Impatiens glandulifera]|uniref:zinc finger CCCH domain-containing protein 13 isoform X3 n=1 Tax=Impatiens glandulifera TaxID=253017 RepID=UPI001FB05C13|nr:zinc finger CCCH domain-containing protein 13 isoform X3 [Impatiens glandulifera]